MNGAFDGLQGQITKSEDIQAKNDVAIKNNNTQDYLNKLAELGKTPDDLQHAIDTGAIAQLKASYGNAINHDQVRGAAETLLSQRYQQVKQGVDFKNAMLDEKTAPIMDKFKSAYLAGNMDLANQYRQQYADVGGKHSSDLESFARTTGHENLVWDEEKKQWSRNQAMHEANVTHMANQDRIGFANVDVARRNADTNAEQVKLQGKSLNMQLQDKLDQRLATAIDGLGKARSYEAGSQEGTKAVMDSIKEMFGKDENGAANARMAFNEILQKYPGISTADAMKAVGGQDVSRIYKNDSWVRDNTVERAGQFAGTKESQERNAALLAQRAAAELYYKNAKKAAEAGPLAALKSGIKVGGSGVAAGANPVINPAVVTPVTPPAAPAAVTTVAPGGAPTAADLGLRIPLTAGLPEDTRTFSKPMEAHLKAVAREEAAKAEARKTAAKAAQIAQANATVAEMVRLGKLAAQDPNFFQ
jgi:hypothetical protein